MPEVIVYRNKEFRVILDANTGRPHLIMLYNGKKKKYHTIYDFEPPLYRKWVGFLNEILWDLGPAIFSIHLGKYQSRDAPHFHAHFFIPITIYVSIAIEKKALVNLDLEGWQDKAIQEGKQYKRADLHNINKLNPHPKSMPKLPYGYKTMFHPTQPRVGFYKEQGKEHVSEIIPAMMKFIKYYGLNFNKKGGAHLVIQHGVYIDKEFQYILGYVQVDIRSYYRINPNRRNWLKEFRKTDYAVLT